MRIRTIRLFAMAFLVTSGSLLLLLRNGAESDSEKVPLSSGLGSVETLEANYKIWEAEYLKNGGDRNMVMSMGWSKGLSTEYTDAHGQAKLNLVDGTVSVEINGLSVEKDWDVWLIDNRSGPGRTVMPEPGDTMLDLGRLKHERGSAKLEANLGSEVFANNEWEIVTVTPAGRNPSEDRVILGMTTLFHRLYHSKQRGQFGVLSDPAPPASEERSPWTRLVEFLSPTAEAQIGPNPNPNPSPVEQLIAEGRFSFFNQTFNGNGRTCGTCHREDNNLTIDPKFIATLPPNDPLFVAEFIPALQNNFEKPELMRKFGLILENVDGFEPAATNFVMRGVPHTLALLPNTLAPVPAGGDGTTIPPNERTGWGGDGAPATGTLREFIIGAITQHYPLSLSRKEGVDFRLPFPRELDSLEAFQRSLGRQADLVLPLSLKSVVAAQGQAIFNNPDSGKCFFCHLNAGASNGSGQNANFNTNVEGLPAQPDNQPDGGFGRTGTLPTGGIGNGSFNTPVVVEAADTGPFFHNNSVATIEDAVKFYTGPEFNTPPGVGFTFGGIALTSAEVNAVAAFLRAINALENIRSSIDLEQRAKTATSFPQGQELLQLAISEIEDAIEVLDGAGLHPKAQNQLRVAAEKAGVARTKQSTVARNSLIDDSLGHINAAKSEIVN